MAAAAAKHYHWLQTEFAATRAGSMKLANDLMSPEARTNVHRSLAAMKQQGLFATWVTIEDSWKPNVKLLHCFGSVPDKHGDLQTPGRCQVRCSPQLALFIRGHTTYIKDWDEKEANPQRALHCLLDACLVGWHHMFGPDTPFSPYTLLVRSHMILDLAFVLAVRVASRWLGRTHMPAGYINSWPPSYSESVI